MSDDYTYDSQDYDSNNDAVLDFPFSGQDDTQDGGQVPFGTPEDYSTTSDSSDSVNAALQAIDRIMQYTRDKFGTSGSGDAAPSANANANYPVPPPARLAIPGAIPEDDTAGQDELARAADLSTVQKIGLWARGGDQAPAEPYSAVDTNPQAKLADEAYASGNYGALNEPVPSGPGFGVGDMLSNAGDAIGRFQDRSRGVIQDMNQAVASIPARIISLLQGAGAMDVGEFNELKMATGGRTEDERNVLAVAAAANKSDEDGAAALQTTRQLYDHSLAFAKAALNGVPGKPGDMVAAARAATQAFSKMPDGLQVRFQPDGQTMRVDVSRVGSGAPMQSLRLTPAQFNDLLDIGKSGQFDNVYENGLPGVLQKLVNSPGTPIQNQPQRQAAPARASAAPAAQAQPGSNLTRMTPEQRQAAQQTIATNPWDGRPAQAPGRPAPWTQPVVNPKLRALEEEANHFFPSASQNPQRQAYIQAALNRETKEGKNEIAEKRIQATQDRTRQMGENSERSANTRLTVERERAARILETAALRAETKEKGDQLRLMGQMAGNPLASDEQFKRMFGVSVKDVVGKVTGSAPAQQTQQPQQRPAQGGNQQPPVPGARQDKQGQWRTKGADGLWHLVQ